MSTSRYCEPCDRFLRGDLIITSQTETSVVFEHHRDFQSFNEALHLPCAICSLAWTYVRSQPSIDHWFGLSGVYSFAPSERDLKFRSEGHEGNEGQYLSDLLSLEQWQDPALEISGHLSSHTGSDAALDFCLQKYDNCRENHARCNGSRSSGSIIYPSRLLDVGVEDSLIILRSTSGFRNEEYACLSHCWGDQKPFSLNSGTQPSLSRGLDVLALPRTFRDAILVARRLRIQYLWIDSLCILQDSEADWAREAGRMGYIYARAVCTISATASRNSDGGLFFDRNADGVIPRLIQFNFDRDAPWLKGKTNDFCLAGQYLCDVQRLTEKCIEGAPLNARAWVSQERQLSRRIIHFTEKQLFWECNSGSTCETYPELIPEHAMPFWSSNPALLKMQLHEKRHGVAANTDTNSPCCIPGPGIDYDLYFTWCSFRIKYSQCGLSWDSDKLVALRGIAQEVGQVAGDELIAGLWRSRIIQELCWFKRLFGGETPAVEPTQWIAPSWSWASSNAKIWVSNVTKFHGNHEGLRSAADLVDLDVKSKESGELERACIRIKCKPMHATLTPRSGFCPEDYIFEGSLDIDVDGLETLMTGAVNGWTHGSISFDMDSLTICEPQCVRLVIIQECLHDDTTDANIGMDEEFEDEPDVDCLDGILLRPHSELPEVFERVGYFKFIGSRAVRQVLKARRTIKETVITLV